MCTLLKGAPFPARESRSHAETLRHKTSLQRLQHHSLRHVTGKSFNATETATETAAHINKGKEEEKAELVM